MCPPLRTLAAPIRIGLHVLPSASSDRLPDCGRYLSGRIIRGESNGENRKNCRSQEDDGHYQEHGLPEVRQADAHREAGERSRARYSGWHVYFVLGMRILRKAVTRRETSTTKAGRGRFRARAV